MSSKLCNKTLCNCCLSISQKQYLYKISWI
nr:MAG TPA: hypothetical protein [Caudoviricetes sp.]